MKSLPGGPIGRLVVAGAGELVGLGAVGQHRPDLARAATGGFEDEVAAVWGPAGALVAAGIAGELEELAGGGVHYVEIVVAAGTAPREGQQLAVGGPGGIDDVALVLEIELGGIGAVGIGEIELGNAAAIADEGDGGASFWIDGGRHAGTVGDGQAPGLAAVDVGYVELRIALHGGGKNDLRAVGSPCGGDVSAAEMGEGDELAAVQGIHADLRPGDAVDWDKAGEGDARGVWRPAGSERDGAQGSKRALVGAIVVHDPDFLGAGAGA